MRTLLAAEGETGDPSSDYCNGQSERIDGEIMPLSRPVNNKRTQISWLSRLVEVFKSCYSPTRVAQQLAQLS